MQNLQKFNKQFQAGKIKKILTAHFCSNGEGTTCNARDFSEYSLFLQSSRLLEVGAEVEIEIERGVTLALQGVVQSIVKRDPEARFFDGIEGMEIALQNPGADYIKMVQSLRGGRVQASPRNQQRLHAVHKVKFQSGEKFLQEYTENISQGGMYVATTQPLQPGTSVHLELEIPSLQKPLQLKGLVAFKLDPSEAKDFTRKPGFGVQFINLDDEAKRLIDQHLRMIRILTGQSRGQEQAVPKSGFLHEFLVPELLFSALKTGYTGGLICQLGDIKKTIHFLNGSPVHIASNDIKDNFANFLVDRGVLTPDALKDSLLELASNEQHYADILVKGGMIEKPVVQHTLMAHQEEKLLRMFSWFDGAFEFFDENALPSGLVNYPIDMYEIVARGVHRYYDASVMKAWIGLSIGSYVQARDYQETKISCSHSIVRLLSLIEQPRTIEQLAVELDTPMDIALNNVFTALLGGWLEIVPMAKIREAANKFSLPEGVEFDEITTVEKNTDPAFLQNQIVVEHERIAKADFFDILGVTVDTTSAQLIKQFTMMLDTFGSENVAIIRDDEVVKKAQEIVKLASLAYDTLAIPYKRRLLMNCRGHFKANQNRDYVEIERLFFAGLREIDRNNFDAAVRFFGGALMKAPSDTLLHGYMAWAKFIASPANNARAALANLEKAISEHAFDQQLHYFKGRICSYLGDVVHAAKSFSRALQIDPDYTKAHKGLVECRTDELRID